MRRGIRYETVNRGSSHLDVVCVPGIYVLQTGCMCTNTTLGTVTRTWYFMCLV